MVLKSGQRLKICWSLSSKNVLQLNKRSRYGVTLLASLSNSLESFKLVRIECIEQGRVGLREVVLVLVDLPAQAFIGGFGAGLLHVLAFVRGRHHCAGPAHANLPRGIPWHDSS
eukprot:869908-Amphidinium_carterae.1